MALAGAATNAVTEIVIISAVWNIFITSPIGFFALPVRETTAGAESKWFQKH